MAYSEHLADRVRSRLSSSGRVEEGSRPMDFTGRVMRGFLFVDPQGFDSDKDLDFWIEKAVEFNKLLT